MNKMGLAGWVSALTISSCLVGCGGGSDSPDALPQISLAETVATKEKATITISATASDDKSISAYQWQQVSGPQLTLAQDKTAAVQVTVPAVDSDSIAVLRLTVTDSGGQTAQKNISVNITNNKLPQITLSNANSTAREKTNTQVSALATDLDGSISSLAWKQTAGPAVTITGASTNKISFDTPAIKADTTLSFTLSVTDDAGEVATATANVLLQPNWQNYTINGTTPARAFAGADVELTANGRAFSGKTNSDGSFTLVAKVDDDDPALSFGQLVVRSTSQSGLEVAHLLSDLVVDSAAASGRSGSVAAAGRMLAVNEASTALYALIKQSNKNQVPTDLASFQLAERTLDADSLLEAIAVARLAVIGQLALPAGKRLLDVLSADSLYSAYAKALEAAEPGVISKSITAVLADSQLTPTLTSADIPNAYYQTYAAGERFLARGAYMYFFQPDGTGSRDGNWLNAAEPYSWEIKSGLLTLTYRDNASDVWVPLSEPRLQSLGATTLQLLRDNNVSGLMVRTQLTQQTLQRVVKGTQLDAYRISSRQTFKVLPVTVAAQLLDPPELVEITTADQLLRNGNSVGQLTYEAAELTKPREDLTIPHVYSVITDEVVKREQLQTDVLGFKPDGTGISKISHIDFSWRIDSSGKLVVTFADGDVTELIKYDEGFGYHSALIKVFNNQGQLTAQRLEWVISRDLSSLKGNPDNPANHYWQNMINLAFKDCWQGGRLSLTCNGTVAQQQFGWQLNTWPNGMEITNSGSATSSKAVTWEYDEDYVTIARRTCGSSDCSRRIWFPLKMDTTSGHRRVWTLEGNASRTTAAEQYDFQIAYRLTAYDELPLTSWQEQGNAQAMPADAATAQGRYLVEVNAPARLPAQ